MDSLPISNSHPQIPPPPKSSAAYVLHFSAVPSAPPSGDNPELPSAPPTYFVKASAPPVFSPTTAAAPWPLTTTFNGPSASLHADRNVLYEPTAPPVVYPSLPDSLVEDSIVPYFHPNKRIQEGLAQETAASLQSTLYPRVSSDSALVGTGSCITKEKLRSMLTNEFLATLPSRLESFEQERAACTRDAISESFFEHMRSFESAHEAEQQSKLAIYNLQQKAKGYASKLWAVQSKSEIVTATCGDGATASHTYTFQYGHQEPEVAEKLKKTLGRMLKHRTRSLLRIQFEETTNRLWIQDHLVSLLSEFTGVNHHEPSVQQNLNPSQPGIQRIKKYIDILFQFERSARRQPEFDEDMDVLTGQPSKNPVNLENSTKTTSQSNMFLQSVQRWIIQLAAVLLHYGDFVDKEYLILHVLISQQISSWAAPLVQCSIPTSWSDTYQDFYITQFQLVLCGMPEFQETPVDNFVHKNSMELGSAFDEDDYAAILDQMDIPIFFSRLLSEHKEMFIQDGTLLQQQISERDATRLFTTTRRLFDILIYGLRRLLPLSGISKRIAQLLCQLLKIMGDNLLAIDRCSRIRTTIQAELDQLAMDSMMSLLALPDHGLWTFLPSMPFQYISSPTIALLLEELALDDIQRLIRQPALVITAPPESNRLRQLLSKNPAEAVFLLTALSAMAATRSTIRYAADFRSDEKPLLDSSLSLLVVYLLLDVAYLHTDLRGDLSKPVREVLRSICDVHPRVISFILSFVDAHFEEMGDMTQYLFRELPLENWEMTSTDFKTLKQLLETPPLNSQKARFARQFLSSLHWTQDNSLDHHAADTIPDTIRQELAFSMADMNINYLINHGKSSNQSTAPPDESTVLNQSQLQLKPADTRTIPTFASNLPQAITSLAAHSGIHFSAEQERVRSFMDWCWSMLIQLELQNTPVISANEELRLHLPESSKSTGFLHGQHLFVSTVCMLLTSPSRDSGLFLKEGWKTLSGILQLNQGSVLLDLMAKLIPMAIFSDLELNAHAAHFGALLRDMAAWKQDPMFSRAGKQYAEQQHLSRSNVPPTMIALWSVLQIHLGHGRESDPSGINTKRIAQFWMSAVFSQKDWIARQDLVAVIDVVGKCCFEFGLDSFIKDVLIEQQILLSIEYRRSPGVSAEIMGLAQPSLDRVMDFLPERFTKSIPVPQGSNDPSLLIGTWSVKSFATSLLTQQANVETNSIWFAFYVLQVETHLERDMRIKIGAHYRQHPDELKIHGSIKNVMKATGVTSRKTLQNFAIWRWAQHLLILPYDTFLLPLFWQEFFHLYFGHVEQGDIFYGFKFLEMHTDVVEQLKARLHSTLTYFGQEARKAVKDQRCTTATHLTELHEFYIALYGWINEPLLLTTEVEIKLIRKDLKPERLGTCRLPDPLECSSDLWKDLLPNEHGGPVLKGTTGLETLGLNSENFPPISSDSSSPLKSPIELRSARKHSYSSPEHKIGNCLVKQAKQSPEISIQRPLMSPALITDTTSAQGLFGSPLRTIRDFCKDHQTKIESCEQLDASYLKELGSLYHNEIKISRLEIACSVTPNSSCQSPAIIERKYEEIVQNEQVKMSILENRERARALRSGRVDSGLCMAALELTKTVEQLLDRYTNSSDVEKESTRQLGIQSFYFIVQGLLDDARRYPPTLVILGAIVDTLGKNIVGQDSSQTEPILDLMKTDNFAIALLYKMFNPATLPKEFVKLYRQIANCKGYGLNSKDLLLRQFNVQAWACGPSQERPTVLDRLAFYEVAFTAMVSQQQLQKQDDQSQQATELSTKDRLAIIKSHRELAGTLFMNFLQQDYIEYLRTLFDTCGTMCLEPEALEDYIRILGVEPRLIPALLDGGTMDEATKNGTKTATTVGLSDYDLGLLVQFLVDYFNGCSEKLALGNLLDYYQGYAISIASLYTAILCEERYYTRWLVPSSTGTEGYLISGQNTDKHALHLPQTIDKPHLLQFRIWNDTYMIFQPWLSCLTDRAVDEHHFQGQQGGASRMMFTFVGVVFKMMDTLRHRYRDTTLWFAQLFEFYLDTMFQTTRGQGSINQIMLLHQHLRRLEWKHLEFSQSIIDRILEVRSALNVEARTEFWTYILTEVVDKDESDLRPRRLVSVEAKGSVEWHQTKAAFMRLGFAILEDMESVCGNDLEMRHQFLNVVWRAVIAQGDWTLISLQELYSLLESLNTRWDRTENWNDLSTPMGLLLYWLRMAVGLEGEEDQGSCLLPDRVLIYYGYMMQLLQARLASSAQDSLNVNFKLESIPLVITHLGHVLDVIAGSNSEPRHHGIHRPLLSLIGILNQCGKEPRSFLTAPATSPTTPLSSGGGQVYPFGAVYRGLKQMAFEVETIQLDVARAVCQRLNSIPVMVSLLEVAIEREFDLWSSQQGKGLGNGKAGPAGYPRSIFGLEKNTYFNSFSSMSLNRERVGFEDGSGRQSWLKIISQTEVPELSEGEFMDHGLSQGAVLTIYSRFLQRLKTCEANLEFDEILELGRELTETISKIHLQGAEPWKAHRSLLLVRMFLNLVAKESVNSVTQSRFLNSVRQLCRVLEVWCQDRDPAKGVLGSFGMGKRSTFDAKFRLVTRIIYTYLTVRLADKGISIYDVGHGRQGSSNNNGKSGALPWRKGRQLSEDRASESTTSNQTGNTGVSGTGPIKGEKDSSAGLLIETLAHLPTKNPDYAAVLVLPQLLNLSEDNQKSTVGSLQGPLALLPALAASPLDLVKKTIQPSSSPQSTGVLSTTPPAQSTSSCKPRQGAEGYPWHSTSPTTSVSPRSIQSTSSESQHHGHKRWSLPGRHHTRFSTGSTGGWDTPESSRYSLETSGTGGQEDHLLATGVQVGSRERNQREQEREQERQRLRMRLQYGTKNGTEDLEWAVEQIKDRRLRVLETAEFLEEVIERFYDGVGLFY